MGNVFNKKRSEMTALEGKRYVEKVEGLSPTEISILSTLLERGRIVPSVVIDSTVLELKGVISRNPLNDAADLAETLPPPPLPSVNFHVAVSDVLPVAVSLNACKNPIGVTETVDWIFQRIRNSIQITTDSHFRKTPMLISRCPRGGKTTILEQLHKLLQLNGINAMTVSFNGVSGFQPVADESFSASLFRVITNQLDWQIDAQSPRVVDWDMLDSHIGSQPFVLLIDELNVLCDNVGIELASVLKKYFLDKANRNLVITSHQPLVAEGLSVAERAGVSKLWSDSVIALSDRSLTLVPMPLCHNVKQLQLMHSMLCNGITHNLAAYYGYMPSLMYAVCVQGEEAPSLKFGKVLPGISNDIDTLNHFVDTLITGIPCPALQKFFCFSSAVEYQKPLGVRVKWPLCYVACILRYFPGQPVYEEVAKCIDVLGLSCDKNGDGMVWEQSVRIAILLRFIAAAHFDRPLPFDMGTMGMSTGVDIRLMKLGPGVSKVKDAKNVIDRFKTHFSNNTLVLFVPTEANMQQFDGFCVWYKDNELHQVCGYQCKDNNRGANGVVPSWITKGGHLLRSGAPLKCRSDGPNVNMWTYYNANDTDEFLGWSVRVMRTHHLMLNY